MSDSILLTFGAPFGQWRLATAFLGDEMLDPAVSKWHDEVVPAPASGIEDPDTASLAVGLEIPDGMLAKLRDSRPPVRPIWGGADTRLAWTGEKLAQSLPEARFLICIEHPAHSLAQWLGDAAPGDPLVALAILEMALRRISALVHRYRSRCLVVHVDEAVEQPAALAAKLKNWLGVELSLARPQPLLPLNPLHLLLSEQLVGSRPGMLRDYERLYASCIPLGEADRPEIFVAFRPSQDVVKAVQELQRVAKERAGLAARASAAEADRDRITAAMSQLSTSTQEHTAHAQIEKEMRAEVDRHVQENELMLVQLHEVQEELERYYLAYRDLKASRGLGSVGSASTTAGVEIGQERDTPPHRELGVTLQDIVLAGRRLDQLQARLVEHHGRPGVAFFRRADEPAPLAVWEPTGTEGVRSFVLLLPTDDEGRQRLERMGTSDWSFVQGVANAIDRAFADDGAALPSLRWRIVARRLARQIAAMPERFRFDQVSASRDEQCPGAFIVTFGNANFSPWTWPELRLRWCPRSNGSSRVELLRPEDGEAPLPGSWPTDDNGEWLSTWELPLADAAQATLVSAWRNVDRHERAALLGLLDALPAVVDAVKAISESESVGPQALAAAAAQPLRAALRLVHRTRLRRVLQAARGHIST